MTETILLTGATGYIASHTWVELLDAGYQVIGLDNLCNSSSAVLSRIEQITAEVEIGKVYEGPITKLLDFGALVNLLPGKDGLLHISQIAHQRVEKVEDFLKEALLQTGPIAAGSDDDEE